MWEIPSFNSNVLESLTSNNESNENIDESVDNPENDSSEKEYEENDADVQDEQECEDEEVEEEEVEKVKTSRTIWMELCKEFEAKRAEIELHKASKNVEWCAGLPPNPVISYLEDNIFSPVLINGMISMLHKAVEDDSLINAKTTFNGLDYLAEYIWNNNPNYPERRNNRTYIFDMDWTQNILSENPRPYYPFSRIWTREQAALRIQAFIRGYWVRRRENVQEVRQFWKDYKYKQKSIRKSKVDIYEQHEFYY